MGRLRWRGKGTGAMTKLEEHIARLQNYSNKGTFIFSQNDVFSIVCNIPISNNLSGVYLFYDLATNELLYVGISGREGINGEMAHRNDGLRGRFLTGKQFGSSRRHSLSIQMKEDSISALKIDWFITYEGNIKDIPRQIESSIIEAFKIENSGRRPRWNKRD